MKLILAITLIMFSNHVFGQTDEKHPIDIELQNCLNLTENYSTKGMLDCFKRAIEKWDNELKKNYQELLTLLTPELKENLKKAQKKWMTYYRQENKFSNNLYYGMYGTLWHITAAQTTLELIRHRAIELGNYISNLTLDK